MQLSTWRKLGTRLSAFVLMAFAVAALGASGPTTIHDAGAASVSYPEFFSVLESLRA